MAETVLHIGKRRFFSPADTFTESVYIRVIEILGVESVHALLLRAVWVRYVMMLETDDVSAIDLLTFLYLRA